MRIIKYQLKCERDPNLSVLEQIFKNREITDVYHYLHTTDKDILNPLLLDNMERGAKMLVSHIHANDNIFIQVDADCDGYTSSAILLNYLHKVCPYFTENNIYYAFHATKAHGIDYDNFPKGVDIKLVIAPDSSSNQKQEHEELKAKGIDVLVIDHHHSNEEGSPACIINNQLCDYDNKSLSGAGVVFKFCQYLDSLLGINYSDDLLDLAALGIIADVMPFNHYETRRLIDKGTKNLKNPFIMAMADKNAYSMNNKVTPTGIAWYIAPSINSITRVGTLTEKRVLFEAMLDYKAYNQIASIKRGHKPGETESVVEQAVRMCTNAKKKQNDMRDKALPQIAQIIEDEGLLNNKILIIRLNFEADRALTGLIANKIMDIYKRPTLILNKVVDEDKIVHWDGSGRNCPNPDFRDLRAFLEESSLVTYAEGHAGAFGVSILEDNIQKLNEYANEKLADIEFQNVYEPDVIFDQYNLYGADILSVASLDWVWGQGVSEPLIAIEGLPVTAGNLDFYRGTTIKITPKDLDDTGLSLIMFGADEEIYDSLYSPYGCVYINIVGHCAINAYSGGAPQIKIKDFEIVRKQDYYF